MVVELVLSLRRPQKASVQRMMTITTTKLASADVPLSPSSEMPLIQATRPMAIMIRNPIRIGMKLCVTNAMTIAPRMTAI